MSAQTVAAASPPSSAAPVPTPSVRPKVSVEEYLEKERTSAIRHEYVDGEVIAMAGATAEHNEINGNIYFALRVAFGDRPCRAYFTDVRTRVTPTQYRYPDVVALCEEARFDNERPPALLNPAVVIEVLSPSTEEFDREEKFIEYRQVVGLTDYILVAQDQALVIHYARQSPGRWILIEHTDLSETLTIASLEVSLPLTEIYRRVPLPTSDAPASALPS